MIGPERVKVQEIVAAVAVAGALAVAGVVTVRANRPPEPVPITRSEAQTFVNVHVTGAVIWPGLYALKAGARIQDALTAAHGPTYDADLTRVNLAAALRDGDRVVIPKIVIPPLAETRAGSAPRSPRGQAPPAAGPATRSPREQAPPAGEPTHTVNVNTATAADLERLPGVGPVLARRIVEHREAHGLFRQLDDLLQVKGIGPRLFARLRPHLSLD